MSKVDRSTLAALRDRYAQHLVDDVLAWWLAHGPDDARGGVFTCWDNAGERLLSQDKYMWSQGRWIWLMASLADAAQRGVLPLDAAMLLDHARHTAEFVEQHAVLADGSIAFVTDAAGAPKEPTAGGGLSTSVFADLFVVLGFAALARHAKDAHWADAAERLLDHAVARISAGTARTEPYPVRQGYSGFSIPMILVGVASEVHAATGSEASRRIVEQAPAAIERAHRKGPDVREMVSARPEDAGTLLSLHRTPGHVLEACWFLRHAAEGLGLRESSPLFSDDTLADIAVHACEIGWDADHDGLFRYTHRTGGTPQGDRTDDRYEQMVVDTWDTKLWWVHAEALYTTLLLGLRTGRADLMGWHDRLHRYTMNTFPAGAGQEWVQIRRRDGRPLEATVALPVKDPFHIARALLLLTELLTKELSTT